MNSQEDSRDLRESSAVLPGIIWISGFSGAGKTTVARKVEMKLRALGSHVIFLDGDDLRKIFAGRWGYRREDRVELGRVYFRLCKNLAAQGAVVVLAAIAMYDELRDWVRSNIDHHMEVFLRVPNEILIERDAKTKNIYTGRGESGSITSIFDPPVSPDIIIDNYGEMAPEAAAEKIVLSYIKSIRKGYADNVRDEYWQGYYSSTSGVFEASPFARFLKEHERIPSAARILEVGCGNGRDAVYFRQNGHSVTAIDASTAAIALCKRTHQHIDVDFFAGTLPGFTEVWTNRFDVCYSRFVLHAMTLREEEAMLEAAALVLQPGGLLAIECRSINDPLAREGEVISPTERVAGHYRRFIVLDELIVRLKRAGFAIVFMDEADGLAVHGSENPVVIRVISRLSRGKSTG